MPKYRIGCSGFLYESWKGAFYPEDLPHKKWLTFYMTKFDTVELNVTFYRLLKKEAFERWYKETPPDFAFSLKGSRFISHVKKLKDVELPLATFFNATAPLLEKLEVVLWQLPPNLKLNLKNLEDFIGQLKQYRVRHVIEFRHKSWLTKKVFNLLSSANIAVCMADWPLFIDEMPVTADFVYLRRHGEGGNYSTNYTTEQLKTDAKRIKEYMKMGKDVYFYFNNDAFAFAPRNASELKDILESILPKSLKSQPDSAAEKKKKATAARKKTAAKKPTTKKKVAAAPKKTAKKKTVTAKKKSTKKTSSKKKTTAQKKSIKKVSVKKPAAKKSAKKSAVIRKTAKAKKSPAKKTASVRKAATKKAATKKTTAKKRLSSKKKK
jgi:uncharacterized protein YecE (DUF72 family)